MSEIAAKMAMFSSGLFTTSTPFHQQHDSGFYESSPQSRSLSHTSADNLESNYFPLRKNLFGKRRNVCDNIPDHKFSHKHKLLLSRISAFSRRDTNSNKETPRTSRSFTGSDKPEHFAEAETPRQLSGLFLNSAIAPLKQLAESDSGFFGESPERSTYPKSESCRIPFLPMIENLHQRKENLKEESLAYFKHSLNVSGSKNYADLPTSEIMHLYYIYRFQKIGLKPSIADIDFWEKHLLINETNDEREMFLLSWKNKLESISASLEKQPKIDFLSQLHKRNLNSIICNILSNLSGQDLQSASCVSQRWRELVFKDENANTARLWYLNMERFRKEREKKKLVNPFQRPPNFRILGSIENVEQKEQLQLKKTIKEINFDAFIEVGKSGDKHKPMKCPSCGCLSLQDKQVITKCICQFCGYEFCCNCLNPYSNWHFCASATYQAVKPPVNSKKYLRRL